MTPMAVLEAGSPNWPSARMTMRRWVSASTRGIYVVPPLARARARGSPTPGIVRDEERPRGAVRWREGEALVPHTGFEPVVSALRGRCPGPLDECGSVERIAWPSRRPSPGAPRDRPASEGLDTGCHLQAVVLQEGADGIGHLLVATLAHDRPVVGVCPEGLVLGSASLR